MKFKYWRTSEWDIQGREIELNTLEDLLAFKEQCRCEIILTEDYDGKPAIEIYDDYRE